jgi:hypothetical protein
LCKFTLFCHKWERNSFWLKFTKNQLKSFYTN